MCGGAPASMFPGMAADFGSLGALGIGGSGEGRRRPATPFSGDSGQKRKWLKVFETLPPQMLNAYGEAKYNRMGNEKLWGHVVKELRSGAMYMTEFASGDMERRGIAYNRFALAMVMYLKHQLSEEVKHQNAYIMKPELFTALYEEIKAVLPRLEYTLAPRKFGKKDGAQSLRAAAVEPAVSNQKQVPELKEHAKTVYDWLNQPGGSRIRMLMHWQAAGGLSHVSAVHHRVCSAFKEYGNSFHDHMGGTQVSMEEFQEAVVSRHSLGDAGVDNEQEKATQEDFRCGYARGCTLFPAGRARSACQEGGGHARSAPMSMYRIP